MSDDVIQEIAGELAKKALAEGERIAFQAAAALCAKTAGVYDALGQSGQAQGCRDCSEMILRLRDQVLSRPSDIGDLAE